MFRTADGAGVRHLHLGGITATPAHPKLAKAALGAQEFVSWSYHLNGVDQALALKEEGNELWGIELGEGAESLFEADFSFSFRSVVIVVGNERAGIDPGILALCDRILYVPMVGSKNSLNVAVAFGTVSYHLLYARKQATKSG